MAFKAEPTPELLEWLRDYNEAAWRRYVQRLEQKQALVNIGGIMVDAEAIFRKRFRCDSRTCASLDRISGTESCCQEYEVEVTPGEHRRILSQAAEIIGFLSRCDPERVGRDRQIGDFFKDKHSIVLAKENGRCAFSYRDQAGQLWCGLHSLALEKGVPIESIKPMACILFPLVVYRFENGDTLLTASTVETEQLFDGLKDSDRLPCLRKESGDPIFVECRTAIEVAFGKPFYHQLAASASQFLGK